jgi:hypothetical protein
MFDEIKPTANYYRGVSDVSTDAPIQEQSRVSGNTKQEEPGIPVLAEAGGPGLAAVEHLTRAALQDPATLDKLTHASLAELVDAGQLVTGALPTAQKTILVNFLSEDPTLKQEIQDYLRKVLS